MNVHSSTKYFVLRCYNLEKWFCNVRWKMLIIAKSTVKDVIKTIIHISQLIKSKIGLGGNYVKEKICNSSIIIDINV